MRLINIDKVKPEMVLSRPIYLDDTGKILLNTGCDNLNRFSEKLKSLGINYIYVEDKLSNDIVINDVITEQTRIKSKKIIAEVAKNITLNKSVNMFDIREVVSEIIDDILNCKNILYNLADIKTKDDYTFSHSVNVTVISLVIGKLLNINNTQLMNLGTGAILHDIGKMGIPLEILNKPSQLTNEELKIMQGHPFLGFNIVKNNQDIGPLSRIAILTHHEKYDGTGYPNHLKGNEIHEFGRIVAIADVFDALTSDRIYRKKWPIYQAIEYLTNYGGTYSESKQFDPEIINTFIQNVAAFPNGSSVILSNGERGIVKEQNKNLPTRPIIKVVEDKNGNPIPAKEIDLTKHLSIVIIETE